MTDSLRTHETFTFTAADDTAIAAYRWLPDGPPRGIVQITHGMGEHMLRYAPLATTLTARGFVVQGQDHRGHGATAGSPDGTRRARRDRVGRPGGRHRRAGRDRPRHVPGRARGAARAQHGLVRRAAVPARALRPGGRGRAVRDRAAGPARTGAGPVRAAGPVVVQRAVRGPDRLRVALPRHRPGRPLRRPTSAAGSGWTPPAPSRCSPPPARWPTRRRWPRSATTCPSTSPSATPTR